VVRKIEQHEQHYKTKEEEFEWSGRLSNMNSTKKRRRRNSGGPED